MAGKITTTTTVFEAMINGWWWLASFLVAGALSFLVRRVLTNDRRVQESEKQTALLHQSVESLEARLDKTEQLFLREQGELKQELQTLNTTLLQLIQHR